MSRIRDWARLAALTALCVAPCASTSAQDATNSLDFAAISPQRMIVAPRVDQQINGARIGWEVENLRAAFRAAASDGLPIVVVADGTDGGMFANVLRCPVFNTLAGRAHFVLIPLPIVDEESDGARLAGALHMDTAFKSTIAVLELRDSHVNETVRIAGYLREPDVLARLEAAGLSPLRPNPLPLSSVALGPQTPRDCESSRSD